MSIESIRAKAKELGIKYWHVKKPENLTVEISEISEVREINNDGLIQTDTTEDKKGFIENHGFNLTSLQQVAKELGADRIVFRQRKKAFECFKGDISLDFLSVVMF